MEFLGNSIACLPSSDGLYAPTPTDALTGTPNPEVFQSHISNVTFIMPGVTVGSHCCSWDIVKELVGHHSEKQKENRKAPLRSVFQLRPLQA